MTAQAPDRLINKHPRVKFGGMYLHRIIRGKIRTNSGWGKPYEFAKPPNPPKDAPRCSALWRGYVATFRLDADGALELVSYRYPRYLTKAKTEPVHREWATVIGGQVGIERETTLWRCRSLTATETAAAVPP